MTMYNIVMLVRTLLSKSKRLLFISIGLVCLGLGIVGYIMPGLPGTIWLIISATLFLRSSDRLYNFVTQHRLFGNQIREFLETGVIPLRVKFLSLGSMWIFSSISIFLAPYGLLFDLPISFLTLIGTVYIISRPSSRNSK